MTYVTLSTNAKAVAKALNISTRELRLVADSALKQTGQDIRKDFNSITNSWDHPVDVFVETDTRGGSFELLAGTDDKIFNWLEHGTRPHYIFPRRAKALRFLSGFRAKTAPGRMRSGQGGSFGNVLFRAWVKHPGIKPRNWMPKIAERAEKQMKHYFDRELRRWASGIRV